jgi:hypothetical protein
MAGRDPVVPRRTLYKSFVDAGGGEALIGLISIGAITYGANVRQGIEGSAETLESSCQVRDADAAHTPSFLATSGQLRLKSTERSVTFTAPATTGMVDVMWLRDADSQELISAFSNKRKAAEPELTTTLRVGQTVVPLLHYTDEVGVVWRGPTFTVS